MNKPKLLLINPAPDIDRLGLRRRRVSSVPKLNLPLLASYADDLFNVRIIDETVEDIDFYIRTDLVAITVLTQVAHRAYEIANEFAKRGAKIVMGGFHVYFFPDEAAEHADALVIGEAEGVWEQLLQDFLAGKLKKRYQRDTLHNLVGLRKPRLDLVKKEAYSTPNVMETSRGCPHRCAYCAVTLFWGYRYRFRPIQEVVDEIRSMPSGGIAFIDDNIIGLPSRAKELFKAMIPLKRKWYGQADLKLARDPELLDLCAKSGCQWLFMGIESTNTQNLEDVGKSRVNKVKEYQKSIRAIQDAGINVFGSFIFGLDRDDQTVFDNTVQFCVDNRLPAANFYIFIPLPFTRLFDKMEKEGRILHRDWSRYDGNHVVFRPMLMTPNELMDGYLHAYRSLYSIRSILKRTFRPRRDIFQALALNVGRRLNYRYFEEGCRL
jgi:radical SAM superfamily enzyme YgiQ (UPF0313 family)